MKIGKIIVSLFLAGILLLPACQPPAPTTPTTSTSPTTPTSPTGVYIPSLTLNISAQNNTFDKSSLTIHSRTKVTLVFDNKDSVSHNVAIYIDSTATTVIFRGTPFTGPKVMNYEFTAPEVPGTYFFRCDIHPTTMTGSFIVTQ